MNTTIYYNLLYTSVWVLGGDIPCEPGALNKANTHFLDFVLEMSLGLVSSNSVSMVQNTQQLFLMPWISCWVWLVPSPPPVIPRWLRLPCFLKTLINPNLNYFNSHSIPPFLHWLLSFVSCTLMCLFSALTFQSLSFSFYCYASFIIYPNLLWQGAGFPAGGVSFCGISRLLSGLFSCVKCL